MRFKSLYIITNQSDINPAIKQLFIEKAPNRVPTLQQLLAQHNIYTMSEVYLHRVIRDACTGTENVSLPQV